MPHEVADRTADSNHYHSDCDHHPTTDDRSGRTYIGEYFAVCSDFAVCGVFAESGSVFFVPFNSAVVDALPAFAEYRVLPPHSAQCHSSHVASCAFDSPVWPIV